VAAAPVRKKRCSRLLQMQTRTPGGDVRAVKQKLREPSIVQSVSGNLPEHKGDMGSVEDSNRLAADLLSLERAHYRDEPIIACFCASRFRRERPQRLPSHNRVSGGTLPAG
jgi:hypothetical protein